MKKIRVEELPQKLFKVRAITNFDNEDCFDIYDEKEIYYEHLRKLAITLKSYLRNFEETIIKGKIDVVEINKLNAFLEELIIDFKKIRFPSVKFSQTWVDMAYLFFGIAVYYKSSLRISKNTVEMFLLMQTFEKLEKVVYNNMYCDLMDFRYL